MKQNQNKIGTKWEHKWNKSETNPKKSKAKPQLTIFWHLKWTHWELRLWFALTHLVQMTRRHIWCIFGKINRPINIYFGLDDYQYFDFFDSGFNSIDSEDKLVTEFRLKLDFGFIWLKNHLKHSYEKRNPIKGNAKNSHEFRCLTT